MNATALIAEDEALLAAELQAALVRAWPALRIVGTAGHGAAAVEQALALRPDVLFMDIRMPGQTGLEAAAELADAWPDEHADGAPPPPFPALVFVTAYDHYAVQAFEAQAVDYLLKPVQPARLAQTVQRLQALLAQRVRLPPAADMATDMAADAVEDAVADGAPAVAAAASTGVASGASAHATAGATTGAAGSTRDATLEAALDKLRALLAPEAGGEPLRVIQAGVGTQIRMVPVDQVLCFEAADKYVRVLTADAELLIRTPLRELLPRIDGGVFWQIHRGTVVRADAIDSVQRDEAGKLSLQLRARPERWPVSRLYAGRFKAM